MSEISEGLSMIWDTLDNFSGKRQAESPEKDRCIVKNKEENAIKQGNSEQLYCEETRK